MEGRELAYYEMVDLEQADQSIKACLLDAGRNVIAVGYYLKAIRDRELFRDAGYRNIWEYAWGEYGFSKSTAHRYMARNDRFSVGGNSPVMAEEYREYSRAQLQEMLSLDAEQMEQVTPEMTVREIRELKRPKEIPYYEIPGQLTMGEVSLEDFLGAVEEPETEKDPEIPNCPECSSSESHTIRPEDFFPASQSRRLHTPPGIYMYASGRGKTVAGDWSGLQYTLLLGLRKTWRLPAGVPCIRGTRGKNCDVATDPGRGRAGACCGNAAERGGVLRNRSGGLSAYGTPARIYPADSLIATAGL